MASVLGYESLQGVYGLPESPVEHVTSNAFYSALVESGTCPLCLYWLYWDLRYPSLCLGGYCRLCDLSI